MSAPGYFYSPEDQAQAQAIQRRQAYATALLGDAPPQGAYGGLAGAGNKLLGAFLANKADKQAQDLATGAQGRYAKAVGDFLGGASAPQPAYSPPNPTGQSPQISNSPDSGPQMAPPAAPPSAAPPPLPAAASPPGTLGGAQIASPATAPSSTQAIPQGSSVDPRMQALLATGNPTLINQFGPSLLETQMNRENKLWENNLPLPVASKQQSDLELLRSEALEKYRNGLPLTAAEKATLGVQQAQLNKPVSVSFGESLVNPQTGKVVYGGQGGGTVPTGPDGQPLAGDALLKTLPANLQATVKAIGDYRQAPLTGMAMRSPYGAQIASAVNQYNPKYDATQYGSKVKARNDFATGKNGNTVRSLNVSISHLDTLGQLSDALGNGNVPLANAIGQHLSQQTGSAAPQNFDAAKQIVGDEVVKAIIGTGGSQNDREEAAKNISRASSPQQLKGVIQTYQQLLGGQLGGLKQQYEKTTGLSDFEDYLSPEVRTKLQATHSQAAPQAAPASGGWSNFKVHP